MIYTSHKSLDTPPEVPVTARFDHHIRAFDELISAAQAGAERARAVRDAMHTRSAIHFQGEH